MAINEHWNIKGRAHECSYSGRRFAEDELFYTALFEDPQTGELTRRDFCAAAWQELSESLQPFSFWRTKYELPQHDARPEMVQKETAESLLHRLVEEDNPLTENTRFVLAVMLERKKTLKQTATRETEEAAFLIYEHARTGEVLIIRDPELKLWELEPVQREVARLLGGDAATPDAPEPAAPAGTV
ncbi:MAG: hypothetical protein KA004_15330 [Verrucomicrobiales bacterium]|nr:hypothetical protein [Verrucomicrobiales bacterium]